MANQPGPSRLAHVKLWQLFVCALQCLSGCAADSPGSMAAMEDPRSSAWKLSLIAGTPGGIGFADGPRGDEVGVGNVAGIAGDRERGGRLYFVGLPNGSAVRSLDPVSGATATIAGDPLVPAARQQDGMARGAAFGIPWAITLSGKTLYVTDYDFWQGSLLRSVDLDGTVQTVKDADGKPWKSTGYSGVVRGLVEARGKLYVASTEAIWTCDTGARTCALLAGEPQHGSFRDGRGPEARFYSISGLASDGKEWLFVADQCTVRSVHLESGNVATVAGLAIAGARDEVTCVLGATDAVGLNARFLQLGGIAFDGQYIYVAEHSTVDAASEASPELFWAPNFVRVRRVDMLGRVTTVAGSLPSFHSNVVEQDGPALAARFIMSYTHGPGLWVDNDAIYLGTRSAIRKITKGPESQSAILAGRALTGSTIGPMGLALGDGQLYTYLAPRHELVSVDLATGAVSLLLEFQRKNYQVARTAGLVWRGSKVYGANEYGVFAYDGNEASLVMDLGLDLSADLATLPTSIAVGEEGLFMAAQTFLYGGGMPVATEIFHVDDQGNMKQKFHTEEIEAMGQFAIVATGRGVFYASTPTSLYRIDVEEGAIKRVAGDPHQGGCDDDMAGSGEARFASVTGLATDGRYVYLGDCGCHTVRRFEIASKKVTTLVGSPANMEFKPGTGAEAGVNCPSSIVYDGSVGELYIADRRDNIIARMAPSSP